MSCNLCFTTTDIAFQLSSTIGLEFNAKQIIQKHFVFCFTDEDATNDESVCENCWKKVKDFDDFYLSIESHHKRSQANLLYLSPKKETDNLYNDEILDNSNYGGVHQLFDCKMESGINEFQWDNHFPDKGTLYDRNCEHDRNISDKKSNMHAVRVSSPKIKISSSMPTAHDYHNDAVHNADPHKCDLCGICERNKLNIKIHMRDHHIPTLISEPVQCKICGKMLKNWTKYITHKRDLHSSKGYKTTLKSKQHAMPYKCPMCDMGYKTSKSLSRHKKIMHSNWDYVNDKFKCDYWEKNFSSSIARNSHKKSSHPDNYIQRKELVANIVEKNCQNVKEFSQSTPVKTGTFTYQTGISTSTEVKRNVNICGNKPAPDINNDSGNETNINESDTKTNKAKIECNICRLQFTQIGLKRHMKWQHSTNITEFICDICGARYKAKEGIRHHMFSYHTYRNQPKKCEICGKLLRNLKQYVAHKKHQHTEDGKKGKQCHICGRGFLDNSKLKEHISLHTDTLPLKCSLCDKRFRFSSSLSLHRKKEHPNWDPRKVEYKCHYCDDLFKTGTARHAHIKRQHPGKLGEEWL